MVARNGAGERQGIIRNFHNIRVSNSDHERCLVEPGTTSAVLNGNVNPNGYATNAWFEWGTSPTLATFSTTSSQPLGSGTTSLAVNATISGLTPYSTYYYRVAASNSGGTQKGRPDSPDEPILCCRRGQHHGGLGRSDRRWL